MSACFSARCLTLSCSSFELSAASFSRIIIFSCASSCSVWASRSAISSTATSLVAASGRRGEPAPWGDIAHTQCFTDPPLTALCVFIPKLQPVPPTGSVGSAVCLNPDWMPSSLSAARQSHDIQLEGGQTFQLTVCKMTWQRSVSSTASKLNQQIKWNKFKLCRKGFSQSFCMKTFTCAAAARWGERKSSTIVLLQQVKSVLLMFTGPEDWNTYCSAGLSLLSWEPLQHGSASDLKTDKRTHSIINLHSPLWLLLLRTNHAISSFSRHWESWHEQWQSWPTLQLVGSKLRAGYNSFHF